MGVNFETETTIDTTTGTPAEVLPTCEVETTSDYAADVSFESLGLSQETLRALAERGYRQPTPVQAQAFQPAFQGKDLIVRSKTGTGKTAAFALPLLERIPKGMRETEALILCPTRELAAQVATEMEELAKYRDIQIAAIYGGAAMKPQETALEKGAAIVVGTPGRIQDHMRRGNLKLRACRHIVLDEADEMLNQGFYEAVTSIVEALPPERQVLLFSATVSDDIRRLITRYTHEPQTILLSKDVFTVEHIHHVRYDVDDAFPKPRNLLYVLEIEQPENAIIFCNTRDDTELVVAVLNRNGLDAELLNGDLPQKERERVMAKVKSGELAFMVATDLAARGIDISDLGHVINYSLPEDPSVYLHRVGRTGRIGKKGVAINLVSGRELSSYSALEKKYGIQFEKRHMPSPQVALEMWTERHVREIKEAASTTVFEGFLGLAVGLKQRNDADELVAFLMRYFFWHQRKTKAQQTHEEQTPSSKRFSNEPSRGREGRERREGRESRESRESREGREGRESRESRERKEPRNPRRPSRENNDRAPRRFEAPPPQPPPPSTLADETAQAVVENENLAPSPEAVPQSAYVEGAAHKEEKTAAKKPARHLSDRELFEALQSGQPLPWIEDPTAGPREKRERPERTERTERPERHAERPERHAERPERHAERAEHAERPERHAERPERPERPERTERAERYAEQRAEQRNRRLAKKRRPAEPVPEGMIRLWINLGTQECATPEALCEELSKVGVLADVLQAIDLRPSFAFALAPEEKAKDLEALTGTMVGNKSLKIEKAK